MRYLKRTVIAVLCLIIVPVFAQVPDSNFVGTWELLLIEERSDTGGWVRARRFGETRPVGILMYDDRGNMAVQITTDPRNNTRSAERPEFINGYVAYYGTYEINSSDKTITHHRRSHVNADVAKLSVVRYFSFSGDNLTLTVAPKKSLRLTWRKAQ
jgi:hypothetical protein